MVFAKKASLRYFLVAVSCLVIGGGIFGWISTSYPYLNHWLTAFISVLISVVLVGLFDLLLSRWIFEKGRILPEDPAVIKDALQKSQIELKIQRDNERLTQLKAERFRTINRLAASINRPISLDDVLQIAAQGLADVLSLGQVGIALFDEQRIELEIRAELYPAGGTPVKGAKIPVHGNRSMEIIIETKLPLEIYDAQSDPLMENVRDLMIARSVKSILIVPLLLHEQVIGTVGCDILDEQRHFSPDEIELAVTVANLISSRIYQAELLEAATRQNSELDLASEILHHLNAIPDVAAGNPAMHENLVKLSRCDKILLLTINGALYVLSDLAQPEQSLAIEGEVEADLAELMQEFSSEGLILDDLPDSIEIWLESTRMAEGMGSRAVFPLKVSETINGALFLYWRDPEGNRGRNLVLLGQIADALALASERSRLFVETQRRDVILQAIALTGEQLFLANNLDEAIPVVLEKLGQAAQVQRAYLLEIVYDSLSGFSLARRYEWLSSEQHVSVPASKALRKITLAENQFTPLTRRVIAGSLNELSPQERLLVEFEGVKSVLMIPVVSQGNSWGLLTFEAWRRKRSWSSMEIDALKTAADSIGAALARLRIESAEREQRNLADAYRMTAAALSGTLSVDEVFERILANLEMVLPFSAANIMILDNHVGMIVRSKGYTERGLTDFVHNVRFRVEQFPNIRWVVNHRKPLVISNVHEYNGWVALPATTWIESHLSVPIRLKGSVIGLLNLDSAQQNFFTQEHAERLQVIADQAAVALDNANLFEETRRYARRMLLLNQITRVAIGASNLNEMTKALADRMALLIDADSTYITIWNPDEQRAIPTAAYSIHHTEYTQVQSTPGEQSLTRAVLEAGHAVVVEDTHSSPLIDPVMVEKFGDRSLLGLPLVADHHKLGAVILGFRDLHHFSPEEIALGEQAAIQISVAVARMQALEKEREQTAKLSRANEVITALGSVAAQIEAEADPKRVMQVLGEALKQIGLYSLVILKSGNSEQMKVHYHTISPRLVSKVDSLFRDAITDVSLSRETFGLYEQIVQRHKPVYCQALMENLTSIFPVITQDQVNQMQVQENEQKHKAYFLPLSVGEEMVGVLMLWGFYLSEEDLPSAMIFASQIAIALENARLYHEALQASERRLVLHQASQELNTLLEPQEIYRAIHRSVQRLMPCEAFAIGLACDNEEMLDGVYLVDREIIEQPRRFRREISLSGRVMESGKSVILSDLAAEPAQFGYHYGSQEQVRSILSVPMRRQDGKVYGVLTAQSYQPNSYSDDDRTLLEMLAAYAAAVLENARLLAEARQLADTDPLTELHNRRFFFEQTQKEFERARRLGNPLSVILLDIDNFKDVNDTYGHAVGDKVLKGVAGRLRQSVREIDFCGRYGGEEFIALILETPVYEAWQVGERLRMRIASEPFKVDKLEISITVSVGIAAVDDTCTDVDTLFVRADRALYDAKDSGRNCALVWNNQATGDRFVAETAPQNKEQ